MDDDDLIAALAGGDDTALRELFTRHAPWLAARIRKALPPEDVEDVLQETFLAVWKGARTYTPRGTPEAWLWVIARNQTALLLRKRGPATLPLDPGALQTGALQTGALQTGALQTGTDPAEAALAMADLSAAAAALGPEREVWRLMYVEDRSIAEVAELTGLPAGTVKSRAHRARRLLRAALGGTR